MTSRMTSPGHRLCRRRRRSLATFVHDDEPPRCRRISPSTPTEHRGLENSAMTRCCVFAGSSGPAHHFLSAEVADAAAGRRPPGSYRSSARPSTRPLFVGQPSRSTADRTDLTATESGGFRRRRRRQGWRWRSGLASGMRQYVEEASIHDHSERLSTSSCVRLISDHYTTVVHTHL